METKLLILALFIFSLGVSAQSAQTVHGTVIDNTGQLLIGVNIIEKGTFNGTISGVSGNFEIKVSDNATLVFSFVGYKSEEVAINGQSEIEVVMSFDTETLEEVVITAQARGQKNAILEQINSNTIKNVVAADRLQENPDANATEAIGRLPGISVVRNGGEGTGLVVRGLAPRYTSITLNGVQMPSVDGASRGTNLSGISQYALQGAEVYKSLTADMDANAVGGTVNLKLRKTRSGLHYNVMAQKGYNNLNSDFGNYKYLAEFSNRFFDNKLGVLFTGTTERANRSIQTMSAAYGIDSGDPEDDILLNAISLNDITSVNKRQTAMLSLDYQLTPGTTLMLYGMYNHSANDREQQSKSYGMGGAGSVGYNFSNNPDNQTDMFQTALSGESNFNFLNIKADYGLAYSNGNNHNLNGRSWNFQFDEASTSAITSIEYRKMDPSDIVPLFSDDPDSIFNNRLAFIGKTDIDIKDENLNAYLNFTVPFNIGDQIKGNVKFGGMYRQKKRTRDDLSGSQVMVAGTNVFAPKMLSDSLDWIVLNESGNVTAEGISKGNSYSFLNGDYNFGNRFDFDRLNEISDTWESVSDYYFALGPEVYLPIYSDMNKIGYAQNVAGMVMNDQDIVENYGAGYLMSEINIGKFIMFLPGVRYESLNSTMNGFYAMPPTYAPNTIAPVPGFDTSATRSNTFILPMINLRVKPIKSFFIHGSYTKTLSRPDFNAISPNYFVNTGWAPFSYTASNPGLKAEQWTNIDLQFTYHSNKMGLLSATLFYKNVEDKIWNRTYTRIKGDSIIAPFPDASLVNVSVTENHNYDGWVKGIEIDWQTSFYYLPGPLKYFTLSANYTFTKSQTTYPYTRMDLVIPPTGGRPVSVRVDSAILGPMLYQPRNIANISLGFNKKGFNAWLSFQYNGQIYTGKNYRATPRLDSEKDYFYRWDLQLTQKFSIRKVEGFEVLLNLANLSNYTETQHHSGDTRYLYAENYGWTGDLGLRFRF